MPTVTVAPDGLAASDRHRHRAEALIAQHIHHGPANAGCVDHEVSGSGQCAHEPAQVSRDARVGTYR